MTKRTYWECDNSKCTTKIMIDSTTDFCEYDENTIKFKTCYLCKSEYCEKCFDLIIDCGLECNHQVCDDDYCKDKHVYNCELLNQIYQQKHKQFYD